MRKRRNLKISMWLTRIQKLILVKQRWASLKQRTPFQIRLALASKQKKATLFILVILNLIKVRLRCIKPIMAAWLKLGKKASWRYLVIHQMLKTQPKLHRKPKSLMKCSTRFAIGKDESSWHVWQVICNGSNKYWMQRIVLVVKSFWQAKILNGLFGRRWNWKNYNCQVKIY